MTDSGQPPSKKFEAEDELDYLFANASPNPNREGCPPREDLVRVSRQEKLIGDPVYMHIVRCSPCFQEMRALQQNSRPVRSPRGWAVAAAAVLALVAGGSWWMLRSSRPVTPVVVATTLDLRPYSVTRGDAPAPALAPLVIPRARLDATILLPLGAEPGAYEVQLRGEMPSSRVAAVGEAEIRNTVTTLHANLDTSGQLPGPYALEVRRVGGEWRSFPSQLR